MKKMLAFEWQKGKANHFLAILIGFCLLFVSFVFYINTVGQQKAYESLLNETRGDIRTISQTIKLFGDSIEEERLHLLPSNYEEIYNQAVRLKKTLDETEQAIINKIIAALSKHANDFIRS